MKFEIKEVRDAVIGKDVRKCVGEKLLKYGCTRALVLFDCYMAKDGFVEELKEIINASGIECFTYMVAEGEPTSSETDKIIDFFYQVKADGIVALGGGSTIDSAKIAGKVIANGGRTIDYLEGYETAFTKGQKRFSPIIGMPTTGGTGAEVCWGFMCDNESNGIKTFGVNPCTMAIVDPIYSVSVPAYVTAFTGMDALSQCAESLCNTYIIPNPMCDIFCREGLELALKYIPIAVNEPTNIEARSQMLWAATLSGYVLNMRKTHIGHAVANQISDAYHLPHGVGTGCGLSVQVRYIVMHSPEIVRVWAPFFGVECDDTSDMKVVGQQLIKAVNDFQKKIGLHSMKELGIPESFCDLAADNISCDKKWVVVPNPPDFDVLRIALHDAWDY